MNRTPTLTTTQRNVSAHGTFSVSTHSLSMYFFGWFCNRFRTQLLIDCTRKDFLFIFERGRATDKMVISYDNFGQTYLYRYFLLLFLTITKEVEAWFVLFRFMKHQN